MTPSLRPSAMDRHAPAALRVIYNIREFPRDLAGPVCYASGWWGSLLLCGGLIMNDF